VKHIISVYFLLNLLNIYSQDFDSLNAEALKLAHDTDKVNLFYNQGFSSRNLNGQYSYQCAKQAEKIANKTKIDYYVAKANNLLGILFYKKGDIYSAVLYHKKALNLRIKNNDKKGIALSQTNLGNCYVDLKNYKLAENAYLSALEINSSLNLTEQTDNCLLNLGVLNTELNNLTAAENYFNLVLKNSKKRNDYDLQATCLNNLAVIYTLKNDFDAAIANSQNSIKLKYLMDNDMEMADSYLNIAMAYIKKNQAAQALENLLIADSIILQFNYLAANIEAHKTYAAYYELIKDYKKAYHYLKQHYLLQDSLTRASENTNVQFFDNTALKENELINENKFPVLYFNLLILVTLGCGIFIFKNKR
jgi:tetratricopeptide (TPR) repeat protein